MSFEEWLTPMLPRLLRFATVMCGGPDLAQDVAVKAQSCWTRISTMDQPEAYLRRMVVNEHLSWRGRWSRTVPQADLVDLPRGPAPGFADQHADRAELIVELRKLPRRQRAVLVLRFYEGLTDNEIADVLQVSPGTVRSHASRALATLRVELTTADSARAITQEDSRAH